MVNWKYLYFTFFLKDSFARQRILGWGFFFSPFEYFECYPTNFLLPLFLLRIQLSILLWFPCKWQVVFFFLLSRFSRICLSAFLIWFTYLWNFKLNTCKRSLRVDTYILLGVPWASWRNKWKLFSHYFFKYFFCSFLSFSSDTPIMHIVPHIFLKFCSFFFPFIFLCFWIT